MRGGPLDTLWIFSAAASRRGRKHKRRPRSLEWLLGRRWSNLQGNITSNEERPERDSGTQTSGQKPSENDESKRKTSRRVLPGAPQFASNAAIVGSMETSGRSGGESRRSRAGRSKGSYTLQAAGH